MKYFQMALLFFLSFHLGHCSRESRKLHQAILECETQEQPTGDGWRKKGRNDGEKPFAWVSKYTQNIAAKKRGRPEEWGPEWSGPYRHKRRDGLPEDVLYWWDSENKQAKYKKSAVDQYNEEDSFFASTAVPLYTHSKDSDGGYETFFTAADIHPTSVGWQPNESQANLSLQPPTKGAMNFSRDARYGGPTSNEWTHFGGMESPTVEPGDRAQEARAISILNENEGEAWDKPHKWDWVNHVRLKYYETRKQYMDKQRLMDEELADGESNVRFAQGGFTERWQGRWLYYEPYFKLEFDLWPVNGGFVLYSKGRYTYNDHENAELDRDATGWYRGDVFRGDPPRVDRLKVRHAWQKAIIIEDFAMDKKVSAEVKDTDWAVRRISYPAEMYPYPIEGTKDYLQDDWGGSEPNEAVLPPMSHLGSKKKAWNESMLTPANDLEDPRTSNRARQAQAQTFEDFVGLMEDEEEDNYRYEEGKHMANLKKLQQYDFSGDWWYRTEDGRSIWYRLERQSSRYSDEVEYTFFESDSAGDFPPPGRKLHHEGGGVFWAASKSFSDFGRNYSFKDPGVKWSTADDRDRAIKIYLGWIRVIVMEYQETFKPKTERVALRKYHLQNFRFEGRATGQVGMFQSSAAASRPWMS